MVLGTIAAVGSARVGGMLLRPRRSHLLSIVHHVVIFLFVLMLSGVLLAAWPTLDPCLV